jgi:hypothetical protein
MAWVRWSGALVLGRDSEGVIQIVWAGWPSVGTAQYHLIE